jgi:hypothetical protein
MNGWAKDEHAAVEDLALVLGDQTITVKEYAYWVPYSPEFVAEWTGWTDLTAEQIREQFGDVVLVRQGLSGVELRRGRPDPAQVHAEVTAIIANARTR